MTVPDVVIFPIFPVPQSVNHRLPSDPAAIPSGLLPEGREYSVIEPDVVVFPILLLRLSVNHTLPSGPVVT